MISRRCSIVSFASEGDWSISSDIFSMIVVLVQVNLGGAPILPYLVSDCFFEVISTVLGKGCQGIAKSLRNNLFYKKVSFQLKANIQVALLH